MARQHQLDQVLSFDMGGTTAKICFIDKARPQTARAFEVASIYRFVKGEGPVTGIVHIRRKGKGFVQRPDSASHKLRIG